MYSVVIVTLLFSCSSVTSDQTPSVDIRDDHLAFLQGISDNLDASILEKNKHHQELMAKSVTRKNELREEFTRRFQTVIQLDRERHEELKQTLQRILNITESDGFAVIGDRHLEVISNISKKIQASKFKDQENFISLETAYGQHQLELKNETKAQLDSLNKIRAEQSRELREMIETVLLKFLDPADSCYELYQDGHRTSGVYRIRHPEMTSSFLAYCDMENDNGGWTVIQRRGDFHVEPENFNRTWQEYKNGFGNLNEEFWLGNEKIHLLTKDGKSMLRILVRDYKNNWLERTYNIFYLRGEQDSYKLIVPRAPSGSSDDPFWALRNEVFSTYDHNPQCFNGAGWWYYQCKATTHLNGPRENVNGKFGVTFDGSTPVAFSIMEIKPRTE